MLLLLLLLLLLSWRREVARRGSPQSPGGSRRRGGAALTWRVMVWGRDTTLSFAFAERSFARESSSSQKVLKPLQSSRTCTLARTVGWSVGTLLR